MFRRLAALGAVLGVMALAIGVVASVAQADTQTEAVGEAGTVTFTVEGGVIAFVSADPADGWAFTVEREDGRHLSVTFRSDTGGEAEFEAEIEDGELVLGGGAEAGASTPTSITVPDSSSTTIGSSTTSSTVGASSTTSTSLGGSTSTTIPGDDDDDGRGGGDDDDESATPMSLTFLAGSAGSVDVLLLGDEISFAGASTLSGWEFEVDHAGGSHVDVDFHHEDGTTLEFRVDVDLRVRIEIDDD